jgi:hypothetical protein
VLAFHAAVEKAVAMEFALRKHVFDRLDSWNQATEQEAH